eukprot:NODE_551_length_6164_cov_0.432811.p1 type:complete len:351 gc:universal NODE_551_length_6164_cov_0.432811:2591-1539(-)
MGTCQSKQHVTKNHEINQQIAMDAKIRKNIVKILLLGSGESGKSTLVRQMKIINMNGYSIDELNAFKDPIYSNVYWGCQLLNEAMIKLNLKWSACQVLYYELMESYEAMKRDNELIILPEHAKKIKMIWSDDTALQVILRYQEIYMLDSAPYYIQHLDRIASADYIPTINDILRVRIKTTGIVETNFKYKDLNIHMFDVGGQRSERKKWIHCFEGVTCVIFFISLIDYDLGLMEDPTQNRLIEAIQLFESTVNSRYFTSTSFMLFMNKADLFKDKLIHSPLHHVFPDYTGGSDTLKASKYILSKFIRVNKAKLTLYPYMTCATDTNNIKIVFEVVQATIVENLFKFNGIL